MVESLMAIVIVTIGLFGLLSMQPTAWKTTARTDYLGRAANILNKELATQELRIMNPCNCVAESDQTETVFSSGQDDKQAGDISFNVRTMIARVTAGSDTTWSVRVIVSWPPLNATGIQETLTVNRQESFRLGCVSGCL
jgi:Tfp pilus assembly protein PilV